jgi:hypothetical protein
VGEVYGSGSNRIGILATGRMMTRLNLVADQLARPFVFQCARKARGQSGAVEGQLHRHWKTAR